MKNKKRMAGALLIAGILATSSIHGFAKADGIPINMGINLFDNKIDKKDDSWQDKYMATNGVIKDVEPGKNGTIRVEGKASEGKLGGYDKIKLIVAPSTEIIDYETGKKLDKDVLKVDVAITAYYQEPEPDKRKGLPILVVAKRIVVKQMSEEYAFGIYGKVTKLVEGKDSVVSIALVEGQPTVESENDKMMFIVSETTKIVDFLTGEEITKDDLKEGSIVYGYYNKIVGKNNPSIAPAEKIVVLSNDSNKNMEWATEGEIEDIKVFENDGKTEVVILVCGNKLGDYGYDKINLLVSSNTNIISSENGSNLPIDSLKSGAKVSVYYDGNVSTGILPKGNATKIIVNE